MALTPTYVESFRFVCFPWCLCRCIKCECIFSSFGGKDWGSHELRILWRWSLLSVVAGSQLTKPTESFIKCCLPQKYIHAEYSAYPATLRNVCPFHCSHSFLSLIVLPFLQTLSLNPLIIFHLLFFILYFQANLSLTTPSLHASVFLLIIPPEFSIVSDVLSSSDGNYIMMNNGWLWISIPQWRKHTNMDWKPVRINC